MSSILETHLAEAANTARQIVSENIDAKRQLAMVRSQLADALDAIHELKSQIVTKDNMIEELQALQSQRGSR